MQELLEQLDGAKISRRQILIAGAGMVAGLARPAAGARGRGLLRPGGTLPVREIEAIMQTTGTLSGGVFTISLDRKDLKVVGPNGHPFAPPFALEHTFAFQPLTNGQAFMNAEFNFTPEELNPTMDAIMSTGLVLMAEHQHYIGEKPQTFHYHFHGRGKATDVARWAMKVVKASGTPLPQRKPAKPTTPLPAQELARIIGGKAQVVSDGVVQIAVTRPETFVEAGVVLRPTLNVEHHVNFQPLNDRGTEANCGADFSLLGPEAYPALKTAHAQGFQVHCLYNQQTMITPQLFFSHNLKAGDPRALARSVRRVLDTVAAVRRRGG